MKAALASLATLALVAGCSSSGSRDHGAGGGAGHAALSGSIAVDAASSLTNAFDTIRDRFQAAHARTTINITYGASSELGTQIGQGAPVDVFASASEKNMQDLGDAVSNPTDFVKNLLEIAVPPGNPAHVRSVADLARPGVKVAVCDPAVPCGALAVQVFDNAHVTVRPTASLADVTSTLTAVESGEVDAGLVYVTDVRAAGDKVDGVVIPSTVNASTTYPIAVVRDAKNAPLAQAFVDYVLSAAGRRVLTADGFGRP